MNLQSIRTSLWSVALLFAITQLPLMAYSQNDSADSDLGNIAVIAKPVECPAVPEGAERFRLKGTTKNSAPIRPDEANFPVQFCNGLSAFKDGLGQVRGYLTSDAEIRGTHFGIALMHAEACLFGPPPTVVPLLEVTAESGDKLTIQLWAERTPESPPPPDSEASGAGRILGGTGRFLNSTGEFKINAKSHGEKLPDGNVAELRDIDMCGYIVLSEKRI